MEALFNSVINWATTAGIKVVIAFVILIISFSVIGSVCTRLQKVLEKQDKLDTTLIRALSNVTKIGLKILVIACLVGYLGIETSGISAVIASLGVCFGLAVNGTLSNLAGGAMLLLTRPFSVGDYIEAQGISGTVKDINICHTIVTTVDNKVIYLPNSSLSTGTIVNYSEAENRRVDLEFSVAGNDPVLVRKTLLELCEKEPLILSDPAPFARITDYGAGNGMKMQLRAWCKSGDYWDVYLNLLDAAQAAFEEKNIVVPFNQLDVHMK